MVKKKKDEEIEIKILEEEGMPEIYVNGASGELSPRGDLVMNFFRERRDVPRKEIVSRNGEVIKREGQEELIREIKARIFMDRNNAFGLAVWMLEKILEEKGATQDEIIKILDEKYNLSIGEKNE